jgi:hypothetical protein
VGTFMGSSLTLSRQFNDTNDYVAQLGGHDIRHVTLEGYLEPSLSRLQWHLEPSLSALAAALPWRQHQQPPV